LKFQKNASCPESQGMVDLDKHIHQQVRCELIRLLYGNAVISNIAVIFAVLVLGAVFYTGAPSVFIVAWSTFMVILSVIRLGIFRLYHSAQATEHVEQSNAFYYIFVTTVLGLGWAVLPWLPFGPFSTVIQIVIIFSMVLLIHIGMHSLAADRLTQILYISPLPISVALRFFTGQQDFFFLFGVMALFYLIVMIAMGGKVHSSLLATLQLQFHNKQLISNLEKAMKEAEEASRAKSEFLAAMSHEIRTPLNGVLGVGDLLLKSPLSDKQRKLARIIRESGKSLLYILNDILDISKIEAGKLEFDNINFNLEELLDATRDLFSGKARKKGLVLENHIDPGIPQVLYGDPIRLRQVFSNLIGNAIKFTEHGVITVHTQAVEQDDSSVSLKFLVEDSGIGLSQEQQQLIFDSFVQADSSTTRDYGGTGLGLTICSQLVQLMGGKIGVESEVGKGALFWFTLKLKIPEVQEYDRLRTVTAIEDETTVFPQFDAYILVAEDNLTNQIVAEGMLKHFGCQVDLVSDGQEAVETACKHPYDLIFMDCQMPKLDGYEATRKIRSYEECSALKSIPIIALTAHAMKSDRKQCLDAGMNDYLSKPFDGQQLFKILNHWLPAQAIASQGDSPAPSSKYHKVSAHLNPAMLAMFDKIQRPGKADILNQIIRIYLEDSPDLLAGIDKALKLNDPGALQIAAHTMKSSNGQIGAKRMESICLELETMGREKKVRKEKSRSLFSELNQEFNCVVEELHQMTEERKEEVSG
jgi:signal transduction histidine kinase/CheY-like chemotaxis protein/HPt (histidine-containing phosphotransfer) domain-containing protein